MIVRTSAPKTFSPEFKPIPRPGLLALENGVKLYSFNMGNQAVFKLELIFRTGSAYIDNQSVASMTCSLLREGTRQKSAEELNNLLDFYGSFLDIKSSLDYSVLTLFGRSEFLANLLPVISEILKEPAFLPESIEKHKKLVIQNLKIGQKKTSYWSTRLLRKNIFGDSHAYSRIPSIDEINNIEESDIRKFHQQLVSSLDAILLAGSFDQRKVDALIENNFGDIPVSVNGVKTSEPIYHPDVVEKQLIETTQASIALGCPAVGPQDIDYPLHSFTIKLFGGYFGSRLMKTLREDRGLTYGIHAYFVQLRQGNYLQIASDVKLEAVHESVDIVLEEITKLLNNPVSEDELSTVRNYMLGEYVNDSNNAFDFAGLYKKIIIQKLPESYFDTFYDRIANIYIEEVESIKSRVLNPGHISVVKVF